MRSSDQSRLLLRTCCYGTECRAADQQPVGGEAKVNYIARVAILTAWRTFKLQIPQELCLRTASMFPSGP